MSSIFGSLFNREDKDRGPIGKKDYERGLRSFSVKLLESPDQLPDSIYQCYEPDPHKAQLSVLFALQTGCYDAGLMMYHPLDNPASPSINHIQVMIRDNYDYSTATHIDTKIETSAERHYISQKDTLACLNNISEGHSTYIVHPDDITWTDFDAENDKFNYVFNKPHVDFLELPSFMQLYLPFYRGSGRGLVHAPACLTEGTAPLRKIDITQISINHQDLSTEDIKFQTRFYEMLEQDPRHQHTKMKHENTERNLELDF